MLNVEELRIRATRILKSGGLEPKSDDEKGFFNEILWETFREEGNEYDLMGDYLIGICPQKNLERTLIGSLGEIRRLSDLCSYLGKRSNSYKIRLETLIATLEMSAVSQGELNQNTSAPIERNKPDSEHFHPNGGNGKSSKIRELKDLYISISEKVFYISMFISFFYFMYNQYGDWNFIKYILLGTPIAFFKAAFISIIFALCWPITALILLLASWEFIVT